MCFLFSWQMWSLCLAWESWWDYDPEKEIITWLSHTGFSLQRALLWRHYRKKRYIMTRMNDQQCLWLHNILLTLCFFDRNQYAKLCNLTDNEGISAPVPDFLFELEYCDQLNARFEKTRADRDVFYAFHGSRLENFHSIIHNGLHCHLNKVNPGITASSSMWL